MTRDFYKNIVPFTEFSQLVEGSRFSPVPDSWLVVITDVKGSTRAIREGRYKEVNLIGAAAITCVLNSVGSNEIPFVFGGDGATLLIPAELLDLIVPELQGLQALAQNQFGLDLRVGYISMGDLRAAGVDLVVGKYQLSPGNCTAQMKGGALSLAEEMIKKGKPAGASLIRPDGKSLSPKLEGLSCRLTPIENRNGVILTLLVRPKGLNPDGTLREVLERLKKILNNDFLSARPVSLDRLKWRWPPRFLSSEVKTQRGQRSLLRQWFETALRSMIAALTLTFDLPLGEFNAKKYKAEIITNSDFKKFDETLRMVIDCTLEQALAVEDLLNAMRKSDELLFGIQRSAQALMTCMVQSATTNQHVHFMDGAEGGYALAAVQLKSQLES